jgi:succinyl-CoA synthetase alpha subunit
LGTSTKTSAKKTARRQFRSKNPDRRLKGEDMLHTITKRDTYQDSITLMLLTRALGEVEGVNRIQVMMGTEANKDIFKSADLFSDEVAEAGPNDLVIVADMAEEHTDDFQSTILSVMDEFFDNLASPEAQSGRVEALSWDQATALLPDANLALIAIPGIYAAYEIQNALERDLHAFVFSDNVSVADELRLKQFAHSKGLLVMGPDCGTGVISGEPLGFANQVKSGAIGIVGASGTGIQEVCTLIDRAGGGMSQIIGVGGRDLSEQIGAISTIDALVALEADLATEVIVLISKPPAPSVREKVVAVLHAMSKPVVVAFLGQTESGVEDSLYYASTLEETARVATGLAQGGSAKDFLNGSAVAVAPAAAETVIEGGICGLYTGGTLASEAATLIGRAMCLSDDENSHTQGYKLKTDTVSIIDLGDDFYTQGRPHPMISPETRTQKLKEVAADPSVGLILLDVVLGHGAQLDIAQTLPLDIQNALACAREAGRELLIIGSITGSTLDPQGYEQTRNALIAAGMQLEASNAQAVFAALARKGLKPAKAAVSQREYTGVVAELPLASDAVTRLFGSAPCVVNLGIESFAAPLHSVVHFDWHPAAGGDLRLLRILSAVKELPELREQNQDVVKAFVDAKPFLVDVVPAKTVIEELACDQKTLLHAGPPIRYEEMTDPMQGSCIGAALFEGWAETEEEARALLAAGEVRFLPCHAVRAVGPMGGITSANMPLLVVENRAFDNRAYCTMNEGIGKVLRFGAYDQEVVSRLCWMRDVLGPTLSAALQLTDEGLNLNTLIARAITMGDEFHQRNIAASALFLKEMAAFIVALDIEAAVKREVVEFLSKTDQFFLNIMMATGKAIVDGARLGRKGTVVTTMTRNGKDFGIRIAELGDSWFTAPVNFPQGLFFTGFTQDDANPDIGDSAITETVGVGAMSMIAAPGVVRFVGAGGFSEALAISNQMELITTRNHPSWTIPSWDFKGAPLGIDICKVVETGITPLINTGIAHRIAGYGQVGAGTVRAPLGCFVEALEAYAEYKGVHVD